MDHKDPSQFILKNNTDENTHMTHELMEQRVDKLGTRITLIAILVPVLIGVIFTLAYIDIKKRVYGMHDTGVEELQKLGRDLESRFSSLSVRYAKLEQSFLEREKSLKELEQSFAKKIAPMEEIFLSLERNQTDLKKRLEDTREELSQVKNGQVDKKDLAARFAVIDESLSITDQSLNVIQNDMKSLAADLDKLNKHYEQELIALTNYLAEQKKQIDGVEKTARTLGEDITEIRADISGIRKKMENFVTTEQLPLAVEQARLKLKVQLDEAVRKMEKRIDDLEKKIKSSARNTGNSSASSAPRVQPPSLPEMVPGQILEKDLN